MANVLLTEKCVRACPYCFAKDYMSDKSEDSFLSWDNLLYLADFFEASNEPNFSLLGGEPTLHPDFVEFVLYLQERGFHVTVFTSGILSESKLTETAEYLSRINPEKLSFVCNLNAPELSTAGQLKRIEDFFRAFRDHTSLGVNIYQLDFDLSYLFDAFIKFGIRKNLRIGLAHPILGENNMFIKPADMRTMAERFMSFMPMFERYKVIPGFDCGMPLCVFTDEELGRLFKVCRTNIKFGCGPAIDIGPQMDVWACFPLSGYLKRSIYEFDDMREVAAFFKNQHHATRIEASGLFLECDSCELFDEQLCMGGCVSHQLSQMKEEPPVRKISGMFDA